MEANLLYIAAGVVALVLFGFVAKRLLSLAFKLTLIGTFILALLLGAGFGWWNGWFDSQAKHTRRAAPARTASPR